MLGIYLYHGIMWDKFSYKRFHIGDTAEILKKLFHDKYAYVLSLNICNNLFIYENMLVKLY